MRYLIKLIQRNKDNRPIYITEFGYSSHKNNRLQGQTVPPWEKGVSTKKQAQFAVRFLSEVRRRFKRVKAAFWYNAWEKGNYKTAKNNYDRNQYGYGLLSQTGRKTFKPVYKALKNWNAKNK